MKVQQPQVIYQNLLCCYHIATGLIRPRVRLGRDVIVCIV